MKERIENHIFIGIVKGGLFHTFGVLTIWFFCIRNDTNHPLMALNWYVVCPIVLNNVVLLISGLMIMLRRRGRISEPVFDQVLALLYAVICCANFIFLRKFDLSFLILVLPVIMLLLEHRSFRNASHVAVLVMFYELMQFLPDLLPGEPFVYLGPQAQSIFGIYISICVMILMWETKDAYTHSFKKKEESQLRLNTYQEFLIKKNRDVRAAVHNVKGTGEMILRYNPSPASAGCVVEVMEACDRIVEQVDLILETSRAELFMKKSNSYGHEEVKETRDVSDGTYLYAPGAYVLVADDSAEALNLARMLLARTGMKIDTVKTGSEALKMISYNHYNLIVVDNILSDMSALEVMRSIKEANGVNVDTPVIVCTMGDRDEVRDMYLGEGFADVVRKPLSGEQIERLTEKYLPARLVSRRRES